MARTLEKPRSAENPRVEVESESSPERKYLVFRALEHTNQQLNLLDSVVAEGISTKDYFDETELIKYGLQEEFPQSLAVQEGMNALISFDQMLADHFYIASERNEDRLAPKKKEALMRLAGWQQSVADFLVGHMGFHSERNNARGVHQQFLSAFEQRLEYRSSIKSTLARETLANVHGRKVSSSELRDAFAETWQGAVGMAAVAHILYSSDRDLRWATAEHDVLHSIDLLSHELAVDELYALQVKTKKHIRRSGVIPSDEWNRYAFEPQRMREIQKLHEGVKRFNQQEGAAAKGLIVYLHFSSQKIDPVTGFVEPEERWFLGEQFRLAAKQG